MEKDRAEQWAAAIIELAVQRFIRNFEFYETVENQEIGAFETGDTWPVGAIDQIIDLIDTATCTIEVDWPPRVKGRPLQ